MNKKMFKQKLAAIIAIIIMFTAVLPPESLQAATADVGNMVTGVSSMQNIQNEISVEGSNSFGTLFGKEFAEKAAEQTENNGYNIFSVDMDKQTAEVYFEAAENAVLAVCIYSEDGTEMLASATKDVYAGETETEVIVEKSLPQYFYLRGFLVDKQTLRPLCTAYETPNYTQEMQEFLNKTTDDFEEEKVLNLDNDTSGNFAVYSDEIKIIEQKENINNVTDANDESNKYVIENADSNITSLQKGDIFSYQYANGEFLVVKVASLTIDGTTATITGEDTSMDEVFDYVKIDSETGSEDAVVDMSEAEEGVEYSGTVKTEEAVEQRQLKKGIDASGSTSVALSYKFTDVATSSGIIKISGSLETGYKVFTKMYLSLSYKYLEIRVDYSAKVSMELSAKIPYCKIPVGYVGFSPFPGIEIGMKPCLLVESSGKINVNGTLKGTVGFAVSGDEGIKNLSSRPKFKSEIKGEITVFAGIDLSPGIKFLNEKIASVKLWAKLGAEIKAVLNVRQSASSSKVHACKKCIDGEVAVKAEIKYEVSLLNLENLTFKGSSTISRKTDNFYYSFDYGEFGFSKCPYCKYKVNITVIDSEKKAVASSEIKSPFSISQKGQNQPVVNYGDFIETDHITTDEKGKASGYLPAGEYILEVNAGGHITEKKKIYITNEAKNIRIVLKKDAGKPDVKPTDEPGSSLKTSVIKSVSLGGSHSGAVTKDGSLYMWGYNEWGELGDGTTENRTKPVKILDNVVSASFGSFHSGAVTKDGSLYMWGRNNYGQLGDGTTENRTKPVKILENVVLASLGHEYSGAVTKDGNLYMWGRNEWGQLGDGTEEDRTKPVKVLENVVSASLGESHSGAVTKDRSLYMWGYNGWGELGDGTTYNRINPVKVLGGVISASLGHCHSGAVTKDGSLYMWGRNNYGQLGDGTEEDRTKPVKVLENVVSVSLGWFYSGAITKDGSLYMCGEDNYGCLGDGTEEDRTKPVKVLSNVVLASLGTSHSGAVTKDGSLYMWGYNGWGELGDGTTYYRSTPVKIEITEPSSDISQTSLNELFTGNGQEISSKSQLKGASVQHESFSNLLPDTCYNFYVLKSRSVENLLSADNLLYMQQCVTDSAGKIDITYKLDEGSGDVEVFVTGMTGIGLSGAQINVSDLIYSGSEQSIYPDVSYNSNKLSEGEDYIVSGDFDVTDIGDYSVTIIGTGLYTGEVTRGFKVKGVNTPSPIPSAPGGTGNGGSGGGSGGGAAGGGSAPVKTPSPTPSAQPDETIPPVTTKAPESTSIPDKNTIEDTNNNPENTNSPDSIENTDNTVNNPEGNTTTVSSKGKLVIKKTKLTLKPGQKAKIKITSKINTKVTYKSLNPSIATVNRKGVVTAKKAGKAIITVKANGKKRKVTVTVKKVKVNANSSAIVILNKSLKLSKTSVSIKKGKKFTIKKASGIKGKVKFVSANKKIASVSVNGVVKAKKKGKTTILIKTAKKTVKLKVTVTR